MKLPRRWQTPKDRNGIIYAVCSTTKDGIERSAVECHILSPEAVLDLMERHCRLCRALNELPEIQGRRVEAHYLLGKSVQEIAKEEGVSEIAVHKAIRKGLEAMKKFLKNM